MKKSQKAALLSGLVFPGFGQIKLKRYKAGISIILIVIASLFMILYMALTTAYIIIQKELQQGYIDIPGLLKFAHEYTHGGSNNPIYYVCFILIVVCWLYSIIDALVFGKK